MESAYFIVASRKSDGLNRVGDQWCVELLIHRRSNFLEPCVGH